VSTLAAQLASLAVRDPDILHLGGMLQEPAAFALLHVKPVDGAAFVGEYLLQIADGCGFCRGLGANLIPEKSKNLP